MPQCYEITISFFVSIYTVIRTQNIFGVVVNAGVINCERLLHLIMLVVKYAQAWQKYVEFWEKNGG